MVCMKTDLAPVQTSGLLNKPHIKPLGIYFAIYQKKHTR